MTLSEIRNSSKEMLVPTDVAEVLHCVPYSINLQCRIDPSKLGFPVMMMGSRVRIPRVAFLKWMDGERA